MQSDARKYGTKSIWNGDKDFALSRAARDFDRPKPQRRSEKGSSEDIDRKKVYSAAFSMGIKRGKELENVYL